MSDDPLVRVLVEIAEATRRAERDVFGALDPEVRARPLPDRAWSPKDHQAHLTAWKARQADRYEAAQRGEELPGVDESETDALNARLHATRADWSWEAIVREADDVSRRLVAGIRATDAEVLRGSETLVGTTFGNVSGHAQQHFTWLLEGRIGLDEARVVTFAEEVEGLVRGGPVPEPHRGYALYNLACFHALGGRRDAARTLLREVFRTREDLVDWAGADPDLASMRDELPGLAGRSS